MKIKTENTNNKKTETGRAKIPVERVVNHRFLLFGGVFYYAKGGGHDFIASFDTLDKAVTEGERRVDGEACYYIEWFHVFDIETCNIVAKSKEQAHGVKP